MKELPRSKTPRKKSDADENSIDNLRKSIKARSIIHRLTINALAPEEVMSPSQVASAKVLLNKLIPDLKAVEFSGLPNGGLPQEISINIVTPQGQIEEKDASDVITIIDPTEEVKVEPDGTADNS